MNTGHWIAAWESLGHELVTLPAYVSLLEEPRHARLKSMPVWKVFGSFACRRRGCRGRAWTSTECVVQFNYRYDPGRGEGGRGEVQLVREYGQECRTCFGLTHPSFDQEAVHKTVNKLVQRLKKVFYGIDSSAAGGKSPKAISDVHSSARLRKFPHNASRCEACAYGVCYYDSHPKKHQTVEVMAEADKKRDKLEGPQVKIPWSMRIVRGRVTLAHKVLDLHEEEQNVESVAVSQQVVPETVAEQCPGKSNRQKSEADVESDPVTKFDSRTDADKLLASALAKLGLFKPDTTRDDSNANNKCVDYNYFNYYY